MKFEDVTPKNEEVVKMIEKAINNESTVKIYDCKHNQTRLVYSFNKTRKSASLSNPYTSIKESEIHFVIEKILKTKLDMVSIFWSNNGVLHIHPLENESVLH